MNIHEYQGKEILKRYGVRIQEGIVANTPDEAVKAAKRLTEETGTGWHVIKAQIHAGGRGKGGGVKLAKNLEQVKEIADQIIGMNLVTHQTGPEGKNVHKVLDRAGCLLPGRIGNERILPFYSVGPRQRPERDHGFYRRRYGH